MNYSGNVEKSVLRVELVVSMWVIVKKRHSFNRNFLSNRCRR